MGEAIAAIDGVDLLSLTPEQMRQQLAHDGMTMGDFRSSLRDEILVQRLRQARLQGGVPRIKTKARCYGT